jgi:glycosyltransferase involved in cell wall biosynthesis
MLFVGQATVAKGIKTLLDSMALLEDRPIALTIVGERPAQIPQPYLENPRITWVGPVSRSDVMDHYRAADVLIFPSLSDGFGMAQIEAQGWALPIVASRSCGLVVNDGINGLLLPEVTPRAIADAVITLVTEPRKLADFSRGSAIGANGGLPALGRALESLVAA